jgi:hypothetical protein
MVSDLNTKSKIQNQTGPNESTQQNYPLQSIIFKQLLDTQGNFIGSPVNRANRKDANSLNPNKKVPVYIRYCIDLVLKEIGDGDLMLTNNKYKYVRDLPMVSRI